MQNNAAPVLPGMSAPGYAVCGVKGCGKRLRSDNRNGYCRPHQQSETSRFPPRFCAYDPCDSQLRITNKTGYCTKHSYYTPSGSRWNETLHARAMERQSKRAVCSREGCERRLHSDNKTGRCSPHNIPLATGRRVCTIEECKITLDPRNTIGRCAKHRSKSWTARECGYDGCDKKLRDKNLHGFCQEHAYDYRRDYMLRHHYGITVAEYDAMLAEQDGRCYLCGVPPKAGAKGSAGMLHVDHCHATSIVRRLLCLHCNRGLGAFFDSPDLMRAAAAYVEAFRLSVAA